MVKLNDEEKLRVVLMEVRNSITIYKFTLGVDYITSTLREAGYSVWNFNFENEELKAICDRVLAVEPDVVGISFYRETEEQIFDFTRAVKKVNPDIKIFLGGHTCTLYASAILEKELSIDIVVNGEGELTVLDLCDSIYSGKSLDNCKGITYRKDRMIMRNKDRELIENLDELPFPAIDVIKEKNRGSNYVFAGISTSRGCFGKCAFCVANRFYKKNKNNGWRGRTPQNIVDEIKYLIEAFPDKRLFYTVVDSSIEDPDPTSKKRLKEIVRLLEENNINIPFNCFTRAESWSEDDKDLIERMKNVGLYEVSIGYEASTEGALELFNKRASVEDNYRAYNVFKESKVNVFGFLIMIHPYTTLEELKSNADLLLEVGMGYHPQSWWMTLDLWPDSRIFLDVARDGLLLGPEPKGYLFEYAFQDGRIERIHNALKIIGNLKSSTAYANTNEKIKLECLLYDIWKHQYDDIKAIEEDMEEYSALYEKSKSEMGLRQYKVFMKLIDIVEKDMPDSDIDDLINEWDNMLNENHIKLERMWMQFSMKFRRKKVEVLV